MERDSHVEWKVKYTPGVIESRATKNGKVALTQKRETAGAAARILLRADRMRIQADAEDAVVLSAQVLDKEGRPVPTASNMVEFELSGPGKILGVGNGDSSSHEPDHALQRSAFNGFCSAILQARREPGAITIRATSAGLEPASIVVASEKAAQRPFVE